MERLTERSANSYMVWFKDYENDNARLEPCEMTAHHNRMVIEKLSTYEDLEEQGRLIKLPAKDGAKAYRECVHIKSTCCHEDYKCSECPITELFCDEFYKAIDRCYEEAYASGCLAGMDLAKSEAEAKLKELRGGENGN